jgi:hypothetical protein
MRIAICISGQSRTWEKCYKRWLEIFGPQGDIDFYFHLWDYNTLPSIVASHNGGRKIEDELLSEDEKLRILEAFKPKKHIFESRKKIEYWNCELPENKQFGPWCREQFYSLYRVSLLKREYELENDFRYDIVIRIRTDLWIIDTPKLIVPAPGTAYTSHCSWDERFNCYRVGDIFYYADSHTFDQVSEFYKYLSFIPTNWVTGVDCPPPEIALYHYLANIGIINYPAHISMKIMRSQELLDIKGKLDGYEIII